MASRASSICAALGAAALCSHNVGAADQPLCLERGAISDNLATAHDEWPSAAGLASNGELLEIYASPNGTWTLVMTRPDGTSCVAASGEAWHQELQKKEGDDAES